LTIRNAFESSLKERLQRITFRKNPFTNNETASENVFANLSLGINSLWQSPALPGAVVAVPGNLLPLDCQSPASDEKNNTAREPIPGQCPADRSSIGQRLTGIA